ncbi:MAG: S26 family signal peptidase [Proteobacteria bacterium]|nr:S26 family signal peptidase [Pseudomonadota bacterium]
MSKSLKATFAIVVVSVVLVVVINIKYSIMINATGSLGNLAFLVEKGVIPQEKGEYIAFIPPKNPYYTKTFVKIIGGVAGDEVTQEDRIYYVNGIKIGRAKEVSLKGDPLSTGPVGLIPENHYFVYTPMKDSYDSRYKTIGWIPKDLVVGTAHPIL